MRPRSETGFRTTRTPLPDHDELAVHVLGFVAGDAERLERFLALTGLDPASLRDVARETAFLESVLDYMLADEPLLLAFAHESGLKPETIVQVHQKRHASRMGFD